ncbi:MAG: hypothetical protein KKE20_05520, partial [Nanoarchaeota archaeon]|nr:hypothetical protein [Nanoarchaeota archaeon]
MKKYKTAWEKNETKEHNNQKGDRWGTIIMILISAITPFFVIPLCITYTGAKQVAKNLGHDKVTWYDVIVFHTWLGLEATDSNNNYINVDPGENLLDGISV